VKTDSVDLIWGALRRSLWIILVLVVLGIVQMNVIRQRQGENYSATARVILSPTDLAASAFGSGFVDPERLDEAEDALVRAPQLYAQAASRANGSLGSGEELSAATQVSRDGLTLGFTVFSTDPVRAQRIANAVASTYPGWRADVATAAIERSINSVREQISETGADANLTEQLNRLEVLKTLTTGNVLLVNRARGATKVRPNPVRDSMLGLFLGLFVGLVLVGLRETLDTRVRSEFDVEELLDVPVVGTVERLPRGNRLVVLGPHGERYGDVYGLLAASLGHSKNAKGSVIAVTSATANEGKTTTAANLAAALAKRNADVVLVDLDSRNPMVGKVFGLPPSAPGTDDVIGNKVPLDRALRRVVLDGRGPTGGRGTAAAGAGGNGTGSLRLLPMGRSWRDGVAPFRSQLPAFTTTLRKQADYVIIDTPPALATPDITELVKIVDMVLIVVRQGRASRRSLTSLSRLVRRWPDVTVNAVLVDTANKDAYTYYAKR
jgi:Mrp family chromosome partitioning ATPase